MNKFFVSLFLLVSFLTNLNFAQTVKLRQAAVNQTNGEPQDIKSPFVSKILPNGLEIIVLPDSSVPLVTVELAVRNGSFTEPPELNGLSHLFEHMFFKQNQAVVLYQCEMAIQAGGLSDLGKRACANPLRLKPQIGSLDYLKDSDQLNNYNGRTQEEVVEYYYTTTSPYLSAAIKNINDSVRFPTFDKDEFEQEKQVVIGEN